MRIKRFSGALSISVVCHIVVVIIAGFHLVAQDRQFKELLGTEFIVFPEVPKPKVRKPILKSGIKQVKVAFERPPGLAMVENVGASEFQNQTVKVAVERSPGLAMMTNLRSTKPQHQTLNPPNGATL